MVLKIRVRFGKYEIVEAGEEYKQSPTTTKCPKLGPVHNAKKDCGLGFVKAKKKKKKKKMKKQPMIAAAAAEEIRKPINLKILINRRQCSPDCLPSQGFVEIKKPTPAEVQQQQPPPQPQWPIWELSEGQMSDSVFSFSDDCRGGEFVSVNQVRRPTYFHYPEVNRYSGFHGGGRPMETEGVRVGSKYNPVVISDDESDPDDAESVGENDPVDDWSDDGEEVESRPRDLDRF